jgi:hypothetical protein
MRRTWSLASRHGNVIPRIGRLEWLRTTPSQPRVLDANRIEPTTMNSTDKTSNKQAGVTRVRFTLLHLMLFVAAVSVLVPPCYRSWNNLGHADWTRASPFTDVRVDGDAAMVEFRGARYELVSINDASTQAILRSARHRYGFLGEKRFIEDLPEVLAGMGFTRKDTVSLELCDSKGNRVCVPNAPMTNENRNRVYQARHRSQ